MLLKSQILILSRNDWESSSRNNELKFDGHEVPGIREIVFGLVMDNTLELSIDGKHSLPTPVRSHGESPIQSIHSLS